MVHSSTLAGFALLGCLAPFAPAKAQTDPGSLERTRPQVESEPVRRAAPAVIAPALPTSPQAAITQSFVLSAVVIDGATVFSSEELATSFEPYLADRVGQAELEKIAQHITARYREAGYLLSYALVPEQSVQSGIVHIKVVEGYVGRVRLATDKETAAAVSKIFRRMATERPLRAGTLERAIGLGRDVPGVIISDVQISRSETDPALHVLTIIAGKDRVRGLAYADNRGTVPDARGRVYSSLSLASVILPGDQLQVDLFAIPYDDFRYALGQIKGSAPIGSDGLGVSATATYGDQFERVTGPNQKGTSRQLIGEMFYPFIKSRALSVSGTLHLGDSKSELKQMGVVAQRDRIQVIRAWLDLALASTSRIDVRLSISRGIDLGSATDRDDPLASRPFASGNFTKFNASVQVNRPLSDRARVRFDSYAQYSTRPLLAAEEFSLGGSRIGRAFDFNEITGDHGLGAMVEIAYRLKDMKNVLSAVEMFAFADGGGAFREKSSPGLPKDKWLASIGAGARFSAAGLLWSSEIGVPVAARDASRDIRAFFSATKLF